MSPVTEAPDIRKTIKNEICRYVAGIPMTAAVFDFTPEGELLKNGTGDNCVELYSWLYDYSNKKCDYSLIKTIHTEKAISVEDSQSVYGFIADRLFLRYMADEYSYALGFNKSKLTKVIELSKGCHKETSTSPEMVVRILSEFGCDEIIITHNHPSGFMDPSEGDTVYTSIIKRSLFRYGVRIADHIIVPSGTDNRFYSFKQHGLIV